MTLQFIEPLTKGLLKIGNEVLLKKNTISKSIDLYTFIQNSEKEMELFIDNTPFTLKANHIISLTPDQLFAVKKLSNCKVYQFNREFYCIKDHDREINCMGVLFYSNTKIPTALLKTSELKKFEQIFNNLIEEFENKDSVQAEMLRVLLKNLIIRTTRLIKNQDQSISKITTSKSELLRQFNILVETNFRKEHQVSFYADQLFKSIKTLSNNFNTLNTSPLQIIHNRIILEAKRLLMYSESSLKEIAFELGFSDPSYLSKLFKKKVGQSLLSFRKENISTKGKIDIS